MNMQKKLSAERTSCTKILTIVLFLLSIGGLPQVLFGQTTTPPSGTTIGNQASATYIDAEGNEQTVTSNSVQTVVQQVASVTVSNGIDTEVAAGGQALFPYTITNTGNGTDAFTFSATDANTGVFDFSSLQIYADLNQDGVPDDPGNPITETPNIGPGEIFGIIVAGTIPTGLTDGDTEQISLDVTSSFDNNETVNRTNETIISDAAVINVTQSLSQTSGNPTNVVTVTYTFQNNGNTAGVNLNITNDLPVGFEYVAGSALWSGSGSNLTDPAGGDPTGISYEFSSGTIDATIDSLSPGQTGRLQFDVTVANGTDGQTISNVGNYNHDDVASGMQTNMVNFTVGSTFGIGPAPVTIGIDSTGQGSTIYFVNPFENQGTVEDIFNITTDNSTYPTGTTVIPYASDGSGNPLNPLSDSNGDGIPDTGPVDPGEAMEVILQVSLPVEAVGNNGGSGFTIDKTATSLNDPTQSVTHTDSLGVIASNAIDLTADAAIGDADAKGIGVTTNGEASPVATYNGAGGSTVTFDLYINNTGPQVDNFRLAASTDNTFGNITLPPNWQVEFRDPGNGNSVITNTGSIPAGGNKQVTVAVILPDSGSIDGQSLYLRSLSPASSAFDVIHTQVGLNTSRRVALEPNNTGQVASGSSIVYEHILSNMGNVDENDGTNSILELELANTKSSGFVTEVYLDNNQDGIIDSGDEQITVAGNTADLPASVGTLAPGDRLSLLVKVTATAGTAPGVTNTAILTVRDRTGTSVDGVGLPEDEASDLSTAVNSAVTITKRQALDSDGGPGSYQTGDLNADPGELIYYQIIIDNTTATEVGDIEVTDVIPAYTTLSGTVTASGDGSPVVASDPGDGNTGTLTVTSASLASGESFVIEFAVQIDS